MRLDRLNSIEHYILERGTVSLEELTSHFKVSMNTIRRDLVELLNRGNIEKVYGGVSALPDQRPFTLAVRSNTNSVSKKLIGELAAPLVKDNDTIFLDSGSTIPFILPHIANKQNVTIVTHSLSAMYEASKYPTLKVIALGGLYNPTTSSYVGLSPLEALSHISTNAVFMAATGVSLERGLTNTTYFEAEIKRKVVNSSNKVILMADSSKFDFSSTISFFDFQNLYAVVTDRKPSPSYIDVIKRNGIQLFCGDTPNGVSP